MEIEKFGTLRSLVHDQKLTTEPAIGIILRNTYYIYQKVTAGLSYLHQKGLVHGDIKGIISLYVYSIHECLYIVSN